MSERENIKNLSDALDKIDELEQELYNLGHLAFCYIVGLRRVAYGDVTLAESEKMLDRQSNDFCALYVGKDVKYTLDSVAKLDKKREERKNNG